MFLAYLTNDEVNQAIATQMAGDCGVALYPLTERDAPPDSQCEALLYDLDYLSPDCRRKTLTELVSASLSCPVAVHSYNLEPDQVKALLRNGVAVCRRLEPAVFLALQAAVGGKQAAVRDLLLQKEPIPGQVMASAGTLAERCSTTV